MCAAREQYKQLMQNVFPYLLMVLYSGLPSLLLILLNCLLARVLYVSRRSLLPGRDSSRSSGGNRDAEHVRARYNHVTTMLLALSTSWLVLTAPHTLFKLVETSTDSPRERATFMFLNVSREISSLLKSYSRCLRFSLFSSIYLTRQSTKLFQTFSKHIANVPVKQGV